MKIEISQIRQKIIDWQNGKISKEEMQEWGDNIDFQLRFGEVDIDDDEFYIGLEVASYLGFININLTTKEDIPYVLEYIDTAKRYNEKFENFFIEDKAYKKWYKYRDNINYRKRAEELMNDPFYREYCMSILKSHTKNPIENGKNNHEEKCSVE